MEERIFETLARDGFPIIISIYFITTLNRTLSSLVMAVQSLEKTVDFIGRNGGNANG